MKKIRNTLLLFYLTPVLLLLLASGFFFFTVTKGSLDEELGLRLEGVAATVAAGIDEFHLELMQKASADSPLLGPSQENLLHLREINSLANIYVLSSEGDLLAGTNPGLVKGERLPQLALHETEFQEALLGKTGASILFKGSDELYYKSGFAPVIENKSVRAVVVVEASASFFKNLEKLARGLSLFALAGIGIVIFVSMLISQKMVSPLEELSQMARRMGFGDMKQAVLIKSDNELGLLSQAMEDMRKKVLARDQELNLMLQGIAHEVRNPLGGIELFVGLVQDEVESPKTLGYIKRIQTEIKNLKGLVEDFLDYTKGLIAQKQEIELSTLLDEVKDYFIDELKAHRLTFETICDSPLRAQLDPDQIKRALSNLIKNAIQASPMGGRIVLKGEQRGVGVTLSVLDHGCGMSQEQQMRVFEPFYTTKEKGSGLGLAFVQKIVQAHQGRIEIHSREGEGTEFKIHV